MNELLARLYQDHRHMAKVLTLLRREAGLIQAGEAANYLLLDDAMHYIRHYPDAVHHPHEELIFEVLLERAPELRKAVLDIQREHREMHEESQAVYDLIQGIEGGAMTPRDKIVHSALAFVEKNFDHMRLEESTVFPGADATLTEDDWSAIGQSASAGTDPLFGPIVEQRYADLYQAILQESDP